MFDDDLVQRLVDQATPLQRGVVATLGLWRVSVLAEDERVDGEVAGARGVVAEAMGFCRGVAVGVGFGGAGGGGVGVDAGAGAGAGADAGRGGGASAGAGALDARFREILGPDDLPYDEPEGIAAWLIDVVSIADYVVRTWNEPEESASRCFDVLVSCYSLAGMLEDDPETPSVEALAELEAERQLADLRAVSGFADVVTPEEFEALLAESASLRAAYGRRFEEVLAAH